jgi:hypothetical protein
MEDFRDESCLAYRDNDRAGERIYTSRIKVLLEKHYSRKAGKKHG